MLMGKQAPGWEYHGNEVTGDVSQYEQRSEQYSDDQNCTF